jgi:hypothetical protein
MAILMSDLTVEVYNADYRVLSRIPWQEAVRLILRGAVYVIDVHSPSVRIHSPSLVMELPISVALREYVHITYRADNRVTREGVLQRDRHICVYCAGRAAPTPWTTFCRGAVVVGTRGSTWSRHASSVTDARVTARRRRLE